MSAREAPRARKRICRFKKYAASLPSRSDASAITDEALNTITAPRPTRISVQNVRIRFSCRFPIFMPTAS
jgi:hypothetical protein